MDNMQQQDHERSIRGYRVIIGIISIVLVALASLYFLQTRSLRNENKAFEIQRDTLINQLTNLSSEYDDIKIENDTINRNLTTERHRADSLLGRLKDERTWSYAKIRKYEKELGTLRQVMRGYVRQVDSLNRMNQALIAENSEIKRVATEQRSRAESAEERAQELTGKVRKGAMIKVRDIRLLALSKADREVTRAKRAERLRVDFVMTANELAPAGDKVCYVRVIGPDGYVLANSANSLFESEGEKLTYSATRTVDYQNQDLNVSVFYNGSGILPGKYKISIYVDNYLVGETETILK